MKKAASTIEDRALRALSELGLSENELKIAERHLNSDDGDASILEEIKPRYIDKNKNDAQTAFTHINQMVADLLKKGMTRKAQRMVEFLFALGHSTANFLLEKRWLLEPSEVEPLLPRDKYLALLAESEAWMQSYGVNRRMDNSDIWKAAQKEPDTLLSALAYCGLNFDNSKVYIGSSLYYNSFTKRIKPKNIAELQKRFDEDYTNSIIESDALFEGISDSEKKALVDFFKQTDRADGELPLAIRDICAKAKINKYLTALLCTACLLTFEWSPKLAMFLRVCMTIDLPLVISSVNRMSAEIIDDQLVKLEKIFDIPADELICACAVSKLTDTLARLYTRDRKLFLATLDAATNDQTAAILNELRNIDKAEYARRTSCESASMTAIRERCMRELSDEVNAGANELYYFLIGETDMKPLAPYKDEYSIFGTYGKRQKIESYINNYKHDLAVPRLNALYLLAGADWQAVNSITENNRISENRLRELIEPLEGFGATRDMEYNIISDIYNAAYRTADKDDIMWIAAGIIAERLENEPEREKEALANGDAVIRTMVVLAYSKQPEKYKKELLAYAADSSKTVRERLVGVIAEQRGWESEIVELLGSKKQAAREFAVDVLTKWGAANFTDILTKAMEAEKSAKLRDRIAAALGAEVGGEAAQSGERTVADIVAQLHKGGKKRTLEWLTKEAPLPEVRTASGEAADADIPLAVMLAYSSMGVKPGVSKDAALIAETLDAGDLAVYAQEVLSRWLDSGADSKRKWALYFAAIHGGAPCADMLIQNINQWPLHARGAIAAEAVNALALSSAPSALLTVDSLSRKCKFKQVKAAAAKALQFAAEQLGVTAEQLADRIVPDLGFDERMTRVFDYGTRKFTVRLSPALDVTITDESGKKIKNMPAVGQKDDAELAAASLDEFKRMKKQMKTVVSTQKLRLEQALSTGRQWTSQAWNELFVRNPIMRQFAVSLIWGVYDGEELTQTFRYMEDGTFNTSDEDEYELPQEAVIGLVHPAELDDALLAEWKQQLEDYEITQSVEQLSRTVYTPNEDELSSNKIERVAGKILNGLSLGGKLTGMGWYRGSVVDGGGFYTYYRDGIANGVSILLHFSGNYVGDQDEDVTVYEAEFFREGALNFGSYVYDEPDESTRIKIAALSKRCFSEAVLQLTKATASSSETDPDWRSER